MRVLVFKLFIWLQAAITVTSIGDQNAKIESKSAYIASELKRLGSKTYQNRYESVMANSRNSAASTIQRPSWLYQPSSSSKYSYSNLNSVHLRHARYPSLSSVITRLDNMRKMTTTSTTTTTTTTPSPYQKYKYSDSYDTEELFDSNDVDGDDDRPDYDSWGEDEEEDDDYGDVDVVDNDGFQAEEATKSTLIASYQQSAPNTKLAEAGRQAIEHMNRMNTASRCRDPFPRVLSVQNIYPDPEKTYLPHCTVLHRCSEDTGCCTNRTKTCAPKTKSTVYLYFYVLQVHTITQGSKVEKLSFVNHTECACLDKSDESVMLDTTTTEPPSRDGIRSYRSNIAVRAVNSIPPETIRRCKCPKQYNSSFDYNENSCICDCANDDRECLNFKKGKEHFSLSDRRCIMDKECGVPKCEYGPYKKNAGNCPRKEEKLNAFASISRNV